MDILSSFILFVLVTYSNGLPAVSRSVSLNLPSCPTNSIVLEQFRAVAPCAVYCLEDYDCGANGLACCATDCGSRCVAETILQRIDQLQDEEERGTTEDVKSVDEVIQGDLDASELKDDQIDKELDILKDKLSEMRNEEEQKDNKEDLKEEESKEEEEEKKGDGIKVDEDEKMSEEEDNVTTQGPETEETTEGEGSLEEEEEEEGEDNDDDDDDNDDDDDDDDDDDNEEEEEEGEDDGEDTEEVGDDEGDDEFDTYSTEEDGEEDLEMLLMELLYNLKAKQNSKHSPWNEEIHTSRSLLQRNEPHKYPGRRSGDFMENAMPPPNALESGALNEDPRALDDQLGGYFIDRPYKMDEMKNQEVAGRRSSMEKRDEGFVSKERKDNEVVNRSNIMKR